MRLMSFVVAMWGFALFLGGCGGSGDGGGGRSCIYEESGTIVECVLYVGSDFVSDDASFERACQTASGWYKEGTSCPRTSSYVGHCLRFAGEPGEYHEYYYYYYEDLDFMKEHCAEHGDGIWVGQTEAW